MRLDTFAKKCMCRTQAAAIATLRWQQDISRRIFFLQTANGRDRDDPAHVERTQRVNVRPMIQLVRQQAVTASMSRQKINLPSAYFPANQDIRRRAKWSVDLMVGRLAQFFHLVQTAPADDPEIGRAH